MIAGFLLKNRKFRQTIMTSRTLLIGAFALMFGIAAAAGVYLFGNSQPGPAPKITTVSVVVAASDINRGQTLSTTLLTTHNWPKDMVPEGSISNPREIENRTVIVPMMKGDLILEAKLAEKGAGRGLAAVIPSGMRAVTIQTPNVATGVAGFILPGNKVDVLLTMTHQGAEDRTGGGSTITLLQNLEILAVDQQVDVPNNNKMDTKELRSVTLLVTPAEAARLDLGQNKGTLRLTLRNPSDASKEFVDAITLIGLDLNPNAVNSELAPAGIKAKTQPSPLPKSPLRMVRTIRGTRSGVFQFDVSHPDSSSEDFVSPEVQITSAPVGVGRQPNTIPIPGPRDNQSSKSVVTRPPRPTTESFPETNSLIQLGPVD
jgi:pilus assembly protein CpaB